MILLCRTHTQLKQAVPGNNFRDRPQVILDYSQVEFHKKRGMKCSTCILGFCVFLDEFCCTDSRDPFITIKLTAMSKRIQPPCPCVFLGHLSPSQFDGEQPHPNWWIQVMRELKGTSYKPSSTLATGIGLICWNLVAGTADFFKIGESRELRHKLWPQYLEEFCDPEFWDPAMTAGIVRGCWIAKKI